MPKMHIDVDYTMKEVLDYRVKQIMKQENVSKAKAKKILIACIISTGLDAEMAMQARFVNTGENLYESDIR